METLHENKINSPKEKNVISNKSFLIDQNAIVRFINFYLLFSF